MSMQCVLYVKCILQSVARATCVMYAMRIYVGNMCNQCFICNACNIFVVWGGKARIVLNILS